ncbi:hemerythrin domain-containing protein [Sphingomonas endolithica]|uniref:hemerythrin domain-containing protein n=1 Tax=Sphingomonas endolithica TaxID=2972485 RepID=UPI0021AFEB9D|nr:hemerythrin domain-containing protein [Sphingomonas sp. ZFBP2030]
MADDKSKRGGNDRTQVAGDEPYEVEYFARKHDISRDEAQALIDRIGNDRGKLDAAAAEQKGSAPAKPRRATRTPAAASSDTAPKPRRTARTAAASSDTSAKPRRAKAAAAPKRAAAARVADALSLAAVADTVSEAVVEPVAEIVAPVTRRAKAATKAVKDGSAKVGTTVAKTPAAVRKSTRNTVSSVKKAGSGRTASFVGAAAAGLVTGLVLNLGRKAAVQAPSALAGDWFDAVKLEHRMALALFDKLQATGDENTTQRSVLLTQLKHALGKHAFTEENVLYPALRAWGDTADADKLNHDHGYVKQNLYDLEQMDNASPAFLEKVATFRAEIEEHIREEEEAIFPPLHAALSDADNARVTAMANKEGFKLA